MTQAPPYTISLKTADYLAKIVETVTRLEVRTDFKRDIRLHRKNRVRSIYSSLAIEGNTLSLDEVADVINGKLVAGKQAEIKEVKNAFAAYDKIMTFDPYKVKDFLKAHKLMTDGLVSEAGKFRSGDVGVFAGDVLIHAGARPQFVLERIADLLGWAKETELHPVIKSAVVHSEIETIHPFADGNGRTGRLWQILILAKRNPLFEWIPMESVVYEKRQEYYDALHAAQNANDSGVFIEFILSVLLETVEAQAKIQADERKVSEDSRQNERRMSEVLSEADLRKLQPILDYIETKGAITPQEAQKVTGKSPATVRRYLALMCERGILESSGSTSSIIYKLIQIGLPDLKRGVHSNC
jgi:Fic family protein